MHATDQAVYLMLKYLETVRHDPKTAFEEARYYEDLLLALVNDQSSPDVQSYAGEVRSRRAAEPEWRTDVELVASTRDYNVVAVELAQTYFERSLRMALISLRNWDNWISPGATFSKIPSWSAILSNSASASGERIAASCDIAQPRSF